MEDILPDTEDQSIVVAFDLYGTLADPGSITQKLAEFVRDKADAVSASFRRYQLEYTWRHNSMGTYEPFDIVVKKALQHALKEHKATIPGSKLNSILSAFDALDSFPDVAPTIAKLAQNRHIRPVIFSNGTNAMTTASIANIKEISAFSDIPEPIVSVDDIEKYKPHPMSYEWLAAKMGKGMHGVGEIVLVSGNAFDIVGSSEVGLKACFVDRHGNGWQDGLGSPTYIVKSLEEVVGIAEELLKERGWGQPEQQEDEDEDVEKINQDLKTTDLNSSDQDIAQEASLPL